MKKNSPVLERLEEVYRVDKTFLKILETQARHSDDLLFVNSCLQNLISETKTRTVAAKQYIDHLKDSVKLPSGSRRADFV